MTTIIIDENTEAGRSLMGAIRNMKESVRSAVKVFTDEDLEDFLLGKLMEEDEKKGLANTNEVLSKLGLKQ